MEKKIVIVGGGFGGVRAALDLAKKNIPNTKIILISDKPHFEYHASLYRVVTGRSPLEVCIPLAEIFKRYSNRHSGKRGTSASRIPWRFWTSQNDNVVDVEVVEDTIAEVDLKKKRLAGSSGSHYAYDSLVLSLGSKTSYFDLPGFREFAFGFKSIADALRLKRHLHEIFSSCVMSSDKEKECALKFVIVGGGATGVELSGELAVYTKQLAHRHRLDPKLITITLIQSGERILATMPSDISEKARKRLERLGVEVLVNKRVVKEEVETVYLKDMQMKTKTVIWTAGVVPNQLYKKIHGLTFEEKGRVVVDDYLRPKGLTDVFVIGDATSGPHSGMAQTALHQGLFVADTIVRMMRGERPKAYQSQKPTYIIPIGPNFTFVMTNSFRLSGRIGWWIRRLMDFRFFLSILPFGKALTAFRSDKVLWEQCRICSEELS